MYKILIVEDDTTLADGLARILSGGDMVTIICHTLKAARKALAEETFALALLDVNLPDGNGFDFLKEFRRKYSMSIILLTVNDLEADIVNGLELGADDYITKPFSVAVLRARVNAQLRKWKEGKSGIHSPIRIGEYVFSFDEMKFFHQGRPIELSKTEQKLLKLLVMNRGITLSRETLIDRIWTDDMEYVDENALSVTVKRLRDKLDAGHYIKTVYGIGYLWVVEK